ncbi:MULTISPECIES: bactofilin family protein [Anaerotruncus]|uniref:bactofilin family protein n=1 Tax=Anaerotruncus TaxID=244127 RepID=UPI002087B10B|nr:polymer-forming cytoskeletal protein [Anaerotruncus massiliensis (ex Togo et al. 2019)]GKH47271.1 hypothetical protein CE91St45_18330 [Oscillospiraceae bacterium]
MEQEAFINWERRSIIGARARLRGNIACPALEVYGEVAGEISAEGTVLLHPGARVTGSLRAGQVVLRPGAVLTKAQGGSL